MLVCHDSSLIAWGVARLLEQSTQAQVTVICDPLEAMLTDGEFDVVVSDVVVFGGSIAALRELCPAARRSRLIAFSGYESAEQERTAFEAGALAFLTESQAADLPGTVRAIHDGAFVPAGPRQPGGPRASRPALTRRESDVLLSLEDGLTVRQISRRLAISESTVKGYCRALFSKLEVHFPCPGRPGSPRAGDLAPPALGRPDAAGLASRRLESVPQDALQVRGG